MILDFADDEAERIWAGQASRRLPVAIQPVARRKLRMLAAALGPAYVRVSGTWANTTYFDDTGGNATSPPPG